MGEFSCFFLVEDRSANIYFYFYLDNFFLDYYKQQQHVNITLCAFKYLESRRI